MKTRTLLLTLAAGLSAGTLLAQQQDEQPGGPPHGPQGPHGPFGLMSLVRAIDTDHDGILSGAEMAAAPEGLKTLDQDSDGALSPEEYMRPMPPQVEERFRKNSSQPRPTPPSSTASRDMRRNGPNKENRPPGPPRHGPRPSVGILWALDGDGDRTISAAEIAAAPESLKSLDREEDGQLSPREFGPLPPPLFWALDANLNGIISSQEIAGAPDSLKILDSDNDGQLTDSEFRPPMPEPPKDARPTANRDASNLKQRPERPNPPLESALDSDNDGTISAAEMAKSSEALTSLDKNGDGQLGPFEVMARPEPPSEREPQKEGRRGIRDDRDDRNDQRPPLGGPRAGRNGPPR